MQVGKFSWMHYPSHLLLPLKAPLRPPNPTGMVWLTQVTTEVHLTTCPAKSSLGSGNCSLSSTWQVFAVCTADLSRWANLGQHLSLQHAVSKEAQVYLSRLCHLQFVKFCLSLMPKHLAQTLKSQVLILAGASSGRERCELKCVTAVAQR